MLPSTIKKILLLFLTSVHAGCKLEPVSNLHNQITRIASFKWGDGIRATEPLIIGHVRHEECTGDQHDCTWKFMQCDQLPEMQDKLNEITKQTSDDQPIYIINNSRFNTFLYANYAYQMSHFTDKIEKLCSTLVNYQFKIYVDPCDGQYYFYNVYYDQWVYSSDVHLVTHSDCDDDDSAEDYGHGCGDYRPMVLLDYRPNEAVRKSYGFDEKTSEFERL